MRHHHPERLRGRTTQRRIGGSEQPRHRIRPVLIHHLLQRRISLDHQRIHLSHRGITPRLPHRPHRSRSGLRRIPQRPHIPALDRMLLRDVRPPLHPRAQFRSIRGRTINQQRPQRLHRRRQLRNQPRPLIGTRLRRRPIHRRHLTRTQHITRTQRLADRTSHLMLDLTKPRQTPVPALSELGPQRRTAVGYARVTGTTRLRTRGLPVWLVQTHQRHTNLHNPHPPPLLALSELLAQLTAVEMLTGRKRTTRLRPPRLAQRLPLRRPQRHRLGTNLIPDLRKPRPPPELCLPELLPQTRARVGPARVAGTTRLRTCCFPLLRPRFRLANTAAIPDLPKPRPAPLRALVEHAPQRLTAVRLARVTSPNCLGLRRLTLPSPQVRSASTCRTAAFRNRLRSSFLGLVRQISSRTNDFLIRRAATLVGSREFHSIGIGCALHQSVGSQPLHQRRGIADPLPQIRHVHTVESALSQGLRPVRNPLPQPRQITLRRTNQKPPQRIDQATQISNQPRPLSLLNTRCRHILCGLRTRQIGGAPQQPLNRRRSKRGLGEAGNECRLGEARIETGLDDGRIERPRHHVVRRLGGHATNPTGVREFIEQRDIRLRIQHRANLIRPLLSGRELLRLLIRHSTPHRRRIARRPHARGITNRRIRTPRPTRILHRRIRQSSCLIGKIRTELSSRSRIRLILSPNLH